MHVNPPSVLLHVDCAWQLCLSLLHSSTSVRKQYLQYFILFLWFKCLSLLWKGWTQVKARVRAWEHVSWLISQLILHKKNSIEDFRVFPSWFFLYLRVKFTKGVSTLLYDSDLSPFFSVLRELMKKNSNCNNKKVKQTFVIPWQLSPFILYPLRQIHCLLWTSQANLHDPWQGSREDTLLDACDTAKQNQTNSRLIQTGLLLASFNLFEFMSPLTFPWFITN